MKTLFLDFDGVLFDTVLESYLLARYAYFGIEPQQNVNDKEYNLFHSVRYLITNSWHYFYIMKLLEKNTKLEDFPTEYQNAVFNRTPESDEKFDEQFQAKRIDLINNHFDFWNSLDTPYPFFEKIKSIVNDFNIIIVSTKNEEPILRHCTDYGLNISKEKIIGKTKLKQYGSKKLFIENYIQKNNLQKAVFIDDSVKTIKDCSSIPNLKPLCANWGYVANKNDGFNEDEILKIIKEI